MASRLTASPSRSPSCATSAAFEGESGLVLGFGWFAKSNPFPEGAVISVFAHPEGLLLQPYLRLKASRGMISTRAMEPDAWAVLPSDAAEEALGAAVRAAFGRIETLSPARFQARMQSPDRPPVAAFGTEGIRRALGLPPRMVVWSGMRHVSLRAEKDALVFVAMRPEGSAGGFSAFRPPREIHCKTQGTDEQIGTTFREALALCD